MSTPNACIRCLCKRYNHKLMKLLEETLVQIVNTFEKSEINTVSTLVKQKLTTSRRFVANRYWKNVDGPLPEVTDDTLWFVLIMCMLTTQQRSGTDSPINRLLDE